LEKAEKEINIVHRITAEQLEKHYKEENLILIDVRKASEFQSEHLVESVNIPLNELVNNLLEFPKELSFIMYCAGGYRSMIAASILKQNGFDNFVDVIGGFNEIKKTSIPRTKYVCPLHYYNIVKFSLFWKSTEKSVLFIC